MIVELRVHAMAVSRDMCWIEQSSLIDFIPSSRVKLEVWLVGRAQVAMLIQHTSLRAWDSD